MNTSNSRSVTKTEFRESFRRARLVFGFCNSLTYEVAIAIDTVPLFDGVLWHGVYSAARSKDSLVFGRIGRRPKTFYGPKGKLP